RSQLGGVPCVWCRGALTWVGESLMSEVRGQRTRRADLRLLISGKTAALRLRRGCHKPQIPPHELRPGKEPHECAERQIRAEGNLRRPLAPPRGNRHQTHD